MPDKRLSVRMNQDCYDMMTYWAKKEGLSKTEFVIEAIEHYVRFLNHDLDLDSAMVRRLNQLIDVISMLSSNQENLENTIINGFNSMMNISRGTNYLGEE